MAKKTICCPMCCGSGKIFPPKTFKYSISEKIIKTTKKLRNKGYSLREIALLLGYKNMNSIIQILKK